MDNKLFSDIFTKGLDKVSVHFDNIMVTGYGVPLGSKVYYQCDTLIILRVKLITLRATLIILRATLNNLRGA